MFCGNCGKELPEGSKFCSACGWQVGVVGQAPGSSANQGKNVVDAIAEFDYAKMEKKTMLKFALFAGYIVSFLLFVAKWFEAPIVEMFSSKDATFSYLDLVAVGLKTGELFELLKLSIAKMLSQIPAGVKVVAVAFGVLYVVGMIWLVVAAVRTIVGKAIFVTQIGAIVSSFVSAVSAFVIVLVFQNAVDKSMGSDFAIGENILTVTWQLILLILVLLVMLFSVIYVRRKEELKHIVDSKADSLFYMLGRFKYIKWVKMGFALLCVVAVVVWIISAIVGAMKHSNNWSYGQLREDKVNKLNFTYGTYELEEKVCDFYDLSYEWGIHVEEADGVFTLLTLEVPEGFEGTGVGGSESVSLYASKNIDATLYVVHEKSGFVMNVPIFEDGNVKIDDVYAAITLMGIDLMYPRDPGTYRVVMVCDDVKDVDLVFDYNGSGYWRDVYYPGQYYEYYQNY